jgi:hypothetical protein
MLQEQLMAVLQEIYASLGRGEVEREDFRMTSRQIYAGRNLWDMMVEGGADGSGRGWHARLTEYGLEKKERALWISIEVEVRVNIRSWRLAPIMSSKLG